MVSTSQEDGPADVAVDRVDGDAVGVGIGGGNGASAAIGDSHALTCTAALGGDAASAGVHHAT